jgi:hypothetical protein
MVHQRRGVTSLLLLAILLFGIAAPVFAAGHHCCCEAMIGAAETAPCHPETQLSACCTQPVVIDATHRIAVTPPPEIAAPPAVLPSQPKASAPALLRSAPDHPTVAFAALSTCILRL